MKRKKRKDKKKNTKKKVTTPTPATDHHAGSMDVPISSSHKPNFPCRLYKGYHLLKDCPGLSLVSEVWSKYPVSSISNHHVDDAP